MREKPILMADLHTTKNSIKNIENDIREFFDKLMRSEEIISDRPTDFGRRGHFLDIKFDEMNIDALNPDLVNNLREKVVEYKSLRKKQVKIEREIHELSALEKDNMRIML